MLLSIIIPAFNEAELLESTLRRIEDALERNSREDFSWEIIVCDNNSTDEMARVAAGCGAKVVSEPVNQISRARNRGASIASGDWLLFIDADSYPTVELMAEVLDLIEGEEYVGCGTTVVVDDGSLVNKLRMERLNPFFRFFKICGGVFILCRRDAFEAIGGFSRTLFALEEFDFVLRLKRYGRKRGLRFAVLHRHPVVTSGRKGDFTLWSFAKMCLSNFTAVVLLLLSIVLPTKWMPRAPSFLLDYWYGERR